MTNPKTSTQVRWLAVDHCLQEEITLHLVKADGTVNSLANGTAVPLKQRAVASRAVLFPLVLAPGETQTAYLTFSGRALTTFELGLWEPGHYLNESQQEAARKYLVTGGVVFMLMIACVLAAQARQ